MIKRFLASLAFVLFAASSGAQELPWKLEQQLPAECQKTSVVQLEPAEKMGCKCARQMIMGQCIALGDPGTLSAEQLARTVPIYGSTGVVRVKYLSYLNVRGSYSNVLPNDFRMCAAAVTFCRNSPNGEECTVAKAFWGE
jgi:hypothetical protein